MSGGISTGGGAGGFTQSPNAFSGLTNTDLRPRRRGRPVPLLDTTWPRVIARQRKGAPMRKQLTGLIDTLGQSVTEITAHGIGMENREQLLNKSFDEFRDAMLQTLDPILPSDEDPLGDGLGHIQAFAQGLAKMADVVDAIRTGDLDQLPQGLAKAEPANEEAADELSLFVQHGLTLLRKMVTETAEPIETEEDAAAADENGMLEKIEGAQGDIFVASVLPPSYRQYLTDPADLAADYASLSRLMKGHAINICADLDEIGALPDQLLETYPELAADDEQLGKAAPPPAFLRGRSKKPDAGGDGGSPPSSSRQPPARQSQDEQYGDEDVGDGGDPDQAPDQNPDNGEMTDETPQNPIEMITRLASIIVVVGGSILQAQGESTPGQQPGANGTPMDQTTGPGLTRNEPDDFGDIPLQKIMSGEVQVHPTLADELDELAALRKRVPDWLAAVKEVQTLKQDLLGKTADITRLREAEARARATLAEPKGVIADLRTVGKSDDIIGTMPRVADEAAIAEKVERLRDVDPDAAAKELLKMAHRGGGRPFDPMRD